MLIYIQDGSSVFLQFIYLVLFPYNIIFYFPKKNAYFEVPQKNTILIFIQSMFFLVPMLFRINL